MLSPHESLTLNPKRGLLAAVIGNPATYPGLVSIYDATPGLPPPGAAVDGARRRASATRAASRADGKTFYATGTALQAITAIDVTDPKNPHAVWQGNVLSHGMSLSDDGNRAYIADPTGGNMLILDTSEIQARKPEPAGARDQPPDLGPAPRSRRTRSRSRATATRTCSSSTSTRRRRSTGGGDRTRSAPARIIDISDETQPRVIVEPAPAGQPARRPRRGRRRPRRQQPGRRATRPTTATSRRASTRRSSPARSSSPACASSTSATSTQPKEIAYYVAPTKAAVREPAARRATSRCRSRRSSPERREIWYTDGDERLLQPAGRESVWPQRRKPVIVCGKDPQREKAKDKPGCGKRRYA